MIEGKKMLCVEDEPKTAGLIRLLLRRKGHTVEGAVGGAEAPPMVEEQKPDLILLDPMMPGV